ncbi:MAG: hypothetical protein JWM41_142 [Gemmatimonadetes bacterium]|nr:hypothetical protein [Gemmatimonadota bacterium]
MHRPLTLRLLPLALAAALLAQPIDAQTGRPPFPRASGDTIRNARVFGTIDGIVSDTNLVPIHAAFVSILSTKIRVGTGPNGRFRITNVPPGQYLVIVKRVGFSPTSGVVEVPKSDTLRLSYTLTPAVQTLGAVVVTEKALSTKMREFEARRRLGQGQFLGSEEIDKANTVFATELFRKFMSVNVSPSLTSSMPEYYALSQREGGNPQLGACPMQVYLDQVPLPTPFNLDLLPSPKEIAAIEVYAGSSTIPPQFNGYNRGCGVILVWTKDGY